MKRTVEGHHEAAVGAGHDELGRVHLPLVRRRALAVVEPVLPDGVLLRPLRRQMLAQYFAQQFPAVLSPVSGDWGEGGGLKQVARLRHVVEVAALTVASGLPRQVTSVRVRAVAPRHGIVNLVASLQV